MPIEPYLFFDGRCDEALEFYQSALGAKVEMLMRYRGQSGARRAIRTGAADKVMHCERSASAIRWSWPRTARCSGKPSFQGFALSLTREGRGRSASACSRR